MKAFEFRLDRIAEFRRQEADMARGRLEALLSELNRLSAERAVLAEQRTAARSSVADRMDVTGEEWLALSQFQDYLGRCAKQIGERERQFRAAIDRQRAAVVEAERRVKLLDRLRERKFREWKTESERELDALAADSHLARIASVRSGARAMEPEQ
jgi:flagellar export protein FliJ